MNDRITKFITEFIVVSVFAMVAYPLLDMAYCHLISHTAFAYNAIQHVAVPVIVGAVFATIGLVINTVKARKLA